MRPMWVSEVSIRREQRGDGALVRQAQQGDGTPTFLVRMENNSQCVEVRMSARQLANFADEALSMVPAELIPAR